MTLFRDHHDDYEALCASRWGKRYCYPRRYDILVPTKKGFCYVAIACLTLFLIGRYFHA